MNRQYPEWDKYAIIYSPHSLHLPFLSNIEKKTKFILTPELLEPTQPLGPLEDKVNIVNSATFIGMCEDIAYN